MVNPYQSPTGEYEPIIMAEIVTEASRVPDFEPLEFGIWCLIILVGLAITLPMALLDVLALLR